MNVYLLYIICGSLGGFLGGLLGLGGGIVFVPMLFFIFNNYDINSAHMMQSAVSTSLACVVISSMSAAIKHNKNKLIFSKKSDLIDDGLKVSVDLSDNNKICAFVAKKVSFNICFNKINYYKNSLFWKPLKPTKKTLLIEKNKFYILKSKEKIRIPKNLAGEMIPYDTSIGDFRAHYAGFFDPGFGDPSGSYAVLEVKTNELPFILEDGQTIARIKYEKLNKKTSMVYGSRINSNYQNQKLALSKHFK